MVDKQWDCSRILPPHYHAGKMAFTERFGRDWKQLQPDRMSYRAGYRYYREITLLHGGSCYQFRRGQDASDK